jgi:hypothetical protein
MQKAAGTYVPAASAQPLLNVKRVEATQFGGARLSSEE